MGRLDSAIDFINKKIDIVRKDINDGLKFCGIIDEAPPAPIQETPKHNSAEGKNEKPEITKAVPEEAPPKTAALKKPACPYVSTFFPNLKPLRVFIMGILEINETYDPEISPFIKFLFELNEKNVSYPNLAANVETLYKIYSEQKYKERGYVIEKLFDTPSPLLRDPTLLMRISGVHTARWKCFRTKLH